MSHCRCVEPFPLPASVCGLARAATRFRMIVARTGRSVGLAVPSPGERTGVDLQTLRGGGEPSAVQSDFCAAMLFAAEATLGLFMPVTPAVGQNAACRPARERHLHAHTHGVKVGGLASPPSPCRMRGARVGTSRKAVARQHVGVVGRAAGPEADSHMQTSERP